MSKTPSKDQIVSYLYEYQMKPIHRLGQNFLIDESIAQAIVKKPTSNRETASAKSDRFGALTGHLLERGPLDVYEIDAKMCEFLFHHYHSETKITINHEDALKSNLKAYDIVVSNLPYYITTALIEKIYRTIPEVKRARC
jgi:16S rRNA A1518/A1519 N6-dimethyltransferase RsmA/KsgA/DIM1 with predicted DNA glycosylase/AP lyase activity